MAKISDLTAAEIVAFRLKILEPLIHTGSKLGLERTEVLAIAQKHWEFATQDLEKSDTPAKDPKKSK